MTNFRRANVILIANQLLMLLSGQLLAQVSRDTLFAPPDVSDLQISPDGQYLSYLGLEEDRVNIWIASTDTPHESRPLIKEPGHSVFRYQWSATGSHIIYQPGRFLPFWKENKTGDDFVIYSIDVQTEKRVALTSKLDRRIKYSTSLLSPNLLFLSPSERAPAPREALHIDIRSGDTTVVEQSAGMAPVYADQNLEPRLATKWGESGGIHLFVRGPGSQWQPALSSKKAISLLSFV